MPVVMGGGKGGHGQGGAVGGGRGGLVGVAVAREGGRAVRPLAPG